VGQETEDNCLLVSNFSFIRTGCDHRPLKVCSIVYIFQSGETDDEDKPELSDARRSVCRTEGGDRTIRDVLFVSQKGGTLHRSQFFRVSRRLPSLLGSRQTNDTRTF